MIALVVASIASAGIAYSVTKDSKWRILSAASVGFATYHFINLLEEMN